MKNKQPPLASPSFAFGLNDTMLALLMAGIFLYAAVLWTARGPNVEKTDFSLSYVGATLVHNGGGPQLYDIDLQRQLRNWLFPHPVPLFFEHPPFEALLLSPLAALPFRTAYLIWGLVNATVWLALIVTLRPFLPWPRDGLSYVFLWLLFAPLGVALYQGQSSLLVLAAFAITFVRLKRNEPFGAGFALAFGLLKFQFVLPFVLIFLFRRKWLFLRGFAVCSFLLALVSIATIGWSGVLDYARFLFAIGNNPQNISFGSGVDMPTIHGFVFALLGRRLSGMGLNLIVATLSLTLLAWVAYRWEKAEGESSFDLLFAATVAASLLSGAHMFTHDFAPLALAIFLAAAHLSRRPFLSAPLAPHLALRSAMVVFWMFPIYFMLVKWHCLYLLGPVLLLFVWGAIVETRTAQNSPEMQAVAAQ